MAIEAGIIGDGLMFNQNTLVDTNMIGAEAVGLHQKISKLSQEFTGIRKNRKPSFLNFRIPVLS